MHDLDLAALERPRVLRAAVRYLAEEPVTVTAASSPRSAGGRHDYFSEGDYWWPDPRNPDGPYIRRDGFSNPDNFAAHRRALIRLSLHVPALTVAWLLTGGREYADHAARHLRAWFLDPGTLMRPHLRYGQAVRGRRTGRREGVIDTLHLVEVARSAQVLERAPSLTREEQAGIRAWFAAYLAWLNGHPFGLAAREATNNHGTCWVVQAAAFARLTGDDAVLSDCRERVEKVLLPGQMASDGSFPGELQRSKPYAYSLFNLDAMAAACQILSTPDDDLWSFELADGRGMEQALAFMYPFIVDKATWPYERDVSHWDDWPVRHPSLLFGGLALGRHDFIELWQTLDPEPTVDEVVRNHPIRQPLLWIAG